MDLSALEIKQIDPRLTACVGEEVDSRLGREPFTAVNRLRETLSDSATEPKYIETVPRQHGLQQDDQTLLLVRVRH